MLINFTDRLIESEFLLCFHMSCHYVYRIEHVSDNSGYLANSYHFAAAVFIHFADRKQVLVGLNFILFTTIHNTVGSRRCSWCGRVVCPDVRD